MSETLGISNYEFCWLRKTKFEISKVYTIRLQNINVRKFEFVAKNQFLCRNSLNIQICMPAHTLRVEN